MSNIAHIGAMLHKLEGRSVEHIPPPTPISLIDLLCPALIRGGTKQCFCLTSVCRVQNWEGRPRKTKIGRVSPRHTIFKVKKSKVKVTRPLWLYWQANMDIQ